MNMLTSTVARWLFALPFAAFGLNHISNAEVMGTMVPAYMPGGGVIWSYIIGICLILAAFSIAMKKYEQYSGVLLALMLITFVILVHIPAMQMEDQNMKTMGMIGMLKDLSLAGGALTFAGMANSR
jgi:uncharacterized membrane protein